MCRYILVTPAKNEGTLLPDLVNTVLNQTIRPLLWVIVDDGSTDNGQYIIEKAESENIWIRHLSLNKTERDIYFRYPYVCIKGFDFAMELCSQEEIEYDFIGLLDADIILEKNYYEKLHYEFEKDKNLGIACGSRLDIINGTPIKANNREDEPYGGASLFRVECFREIDGYQVVMGPDAVANAKAKMKGWKCRVFDNTQVTHLRPVNYFERSKKGAWQEFWRKGEKDFYLNYSFIVVFLKAFKHSLTKIPPRPLYAGLAYFLGFLYSSINSKKKINDEDVKNYYGNVYTKNMIKRYLNKFKWV